MGTCAVRVFFRQSDRCPQQQGALVLRLLLQDQLGLFQRLFRQPGCKEYLAQLDLRLQVSWRKFNSFGEESESILQVALFHLHHAEHVVSVGELGVDLQGVPELQPGLDQFSLFKQGFSLREEFHLLCFRTAAADHQQDPDGKAAHSHEAVFHGETSVKSQNSEFRSQNSEWISNMIQIICLFPHFAPSAVQSRHILDHLTKSGNSGILRGIPARY